MGIKEGIFMDISYEVPALQIRYEISSSSVNLPPPPESRHRLVEEETHSLKWAGKPKPIFYPVVIIRNSCAVSKVVMAHIVFGKGGGK
jgi:hypothetical protein